MELNELKVHKIVELLNPSSLGILGNIGVSVKDISPYLRDQLQHYTTSGNQIWNVRLPYPGIGQIVQSNIDVGAGYYFAGNGASGFSDYTTVFDQYRLVAIEIRFSPRLTAQQFSSSDVNPRLWTAIDYDDNNTPSRAIITQYETCVTTPPSCGIVRCFQPHAAQALYNGAFTGYGNVGSPWCDVASTTIQHFGIKAVVESGGGAQSNLQTYIIDAVAYVQFRNSR